MWAYTISPIQPIAGQPFTITASFGPDNVFVGSGCAGGGIFGVFAGPSPGSITLTLPAGRYAFGISFEVPCSLFTVDPAPTPSSYTPVTIGGTMLPINRLQILLPWLILIVVLSTVAAYTLTASRKTTKRK